MLPSFSVRSSSQKIVVESLMFFNDSLKCNKSFHSYFSLSLITGGKLTVNFVIERKLL